MITPNLSEFEKLRPKLIPSLLSGFEAAANHIWLILLPVILDLSLWFAPHLQVKTLLQPVVDSMNEFIKMNPQQMANLPPAAEIWSIFLERFNLAVSFRTYPVGIPSLLTGWMPIESPIGKPVILEMANSSEVLAWWVLFVLLGLIASSVYYGQISRITGKEGSSPLTPGLLGWLTLQLLLLSILVIAAILLFGVPALMVVSGITLVNQGVGFLILFLVGMAVIWLAVPVVFSAHGIFTNHFPVLRAIATSIQVVRLTYSSTGLFILICVVLNQGLNLLWEVPTENSWLLLIGIFGHAFISTGLIAASFFYYRDGLQLFQALLAKAQQMVQPSSPEAT